MSKLTHLKHNESCKKCKKTILKLLEHIYGNVSENPTPGLGTLPEHFKDSPHYISLKIIFEALQNYRGHRDFVKTKTLRGCDYFVPIPGFILEFDERQHFSIPRKVSLECYPGRLKLGFIKKKWIALCDKIRDKDNDPPCREEQRAWYDTLRDFLPEIKGLKPTKRLYSKDFVWCSLDPDNSGDIEKFKDILTS